MGFLVPVPPIVSVFFLLCSLPLAGICHISLSFSCRLNSGHHTSSRVASSLSREVGLSQHQQGVKALMPSLEAVVGSGYERVIVGIFAVKWFEFSRFSHSALSHLSRTIKVKTFISSSSVQKFALLLSIPCLVCAVMGFSF